jgi:hypothetical protein
MADEHKEAGHDPMSDVKFLLVGFALLLILWWANGGPQRADLRGIFLQPPPPVGSGAAYGPAFAGQGTTSVPAAQPTSYGYQGQQ